MITISKAEVQAKNKNRVNIFIDGEYSFSVNAELCILHKLKTGASISEQEIEKIKCEDSKKQAASMALNYIVKRRKTELETKKYLSTKGFDENSIFYAVNKLKEYGYLDDASYALDFVSYHNELGKYGPKMIEQKLKQKGVPSIFIDEAMEKAYEKQSINAENLVEKLKDKYKNLEPLKKRDKIYRYMINKGYDYVEIKHLLHISEDEYEE